MLVHDRPHGSSLHGDRAASSDPQRLRKSRLVVPLAERVSVVNDELVVTQAVNTLNPEVNGIVFVDEVRPSEDDAFFTLDRLLQLAGTGISQSPQRRIRTATDAGSNGRPQVLELLLRLEIDRVDTRLLSREFGVVVRHEPMLQGPRRARCRGNPGSTKGGSRKHSRINLSADKPLGAVYEKVCLVDRRLSLASAGR